jgi:phosphomannomutase/phosphoglucomutase
MSKLKKLKNIIAMSGNNGDETNGENTKTSSRSAQRAQEAAKRLAAQRQKVLLYLLAAALLINLVLGWVLYGYLVNDVEARRLVELTEHETRTRTESVGSYLQKIQRQVQQEATRPELPSAFETMDTNALALLEQSIGNNFYRVLKVRLIPVGTATMERNSATPIRFAELDLIRRVERGQDALPELALIAEVWQLHAIAPITGADNKVLGTLLVTLDAEELKQNFTVGDATLGESLLLQKFAGSSPQTVMKVGQGAAAASREYPIAGSHLSVRFTPSDHLLRVASELPTLWVLIMAITSIASLSLAWIASKFIVTKQKATVVAPLTTGKTARAESENNSADSLVNPLYQNQDILDITVIDEDEDILGLKDATGKKVSKPSHKSLDPASIPESIFRAYDIRGVVGKTLTPDLAEQIGQALGSEALDQGEASILVARDGRLHSEELAERLISGIVRSGCHVIDIGIVPTPVLYFATFHLPDTNSGVMVTASHNPAEYNGFKMVINGTTLADDAVMDVRARILRQEFHRGEGGVEYRQVVGDYIDRIFSDVALAGNVSLVIDAGNAVTGAVAPQLFEELGCDVTQLHCELDGNFPNHDPDPCDEKNLQDLIAKVREVNADMGVAFDGDGDRLVVVTGSGKIIWPDQLLMLFARDVLSRNPGADVIFDVKCSRQLNQVISSYGGRPIMWKTGHSQMKAKMIETGALIGGEYSGHIFIKDRWYGFDDGMYAMARLLEIVTLRDQKIDDIFTAFPVLPSTPELKIAVPDAEKFALVKKLIEQGDFPNGKATTIDGLRVDFSKGWGLVRASNTSPALTLRFEAESTEALEKIQQLFKRELVKINSSLVINF